VSSCAHDHPAQRPQSHARTPSDAEAPSATAPRPRRPDRIAAKTGSVGVSTCRLPAVSGETCALPFSKRPRRLERRQPAYQDRLLWP
jgi:hypothetical protein